MTRVVCFFPIPDPAMAVPTRLIADLRARFPDCIFDFVEQPASVATPLAVAEVFFSPVITPEILAAAPRLRWFHCSGIQVAEFLDPSVFAAPITISTSRGVHAVTVADHVMKVLMDWFPSAPLAGRTLGIIGLGGNGRAVAQRAAALGMRVVATRRHPDGTSVDGVERVLPHTALPDVLAQAEILVTTVPLTRETRGLLDAGALGLLPDGACLIHTGRPAILVEAAVLSALQSGRLAGLALDDTWQRESPIRQHARTIIFPHIHPKMPGAWDRVFALFADNLERYLSQQPLRNRLDVELHY